MVTSDKKKKAAYVEDIDDDDDDDDEANITRIEDKIQSQGESFWSSGSLWMVIGSAIIIIIPNVLYCIYKLYPYCRGSGKEKPLTDSKIRHRYEEHSQELFSESLINMSGSTAKVHAFQALEKESRKSWRKAKRGKSKRDGGHPLSRKCPHSGVHAYD